MEKLNISDDIREYNPDMSVPIKVKDYMELEKRIEALEKENKELSELKNSDNDLKSILKYYLQFQAIDKKNILCLHDSILYGLASTIKKTKNCLGIRIRERLNKKDDEMFASLLLDLVANIVLEEYRYDDSVFNYSERLGETSDNE